MSSLALRSTWTSFLPLPRPQSTLPMIDPHVYAGATVVAPKKMSKRIEATRDSRDMIKVIAVLRASDWQLYNAENLMFAPSLKANI